MITKPYLIVLFLLYPFFIGYGQTVLSESDIAIIGIDTGTEDFIFVTFVHLDPGTQIYFTDEEASGTYTIGIGEGTVLYTAPIGGVIAGSVISYKTNATNFSDTSDGAIALNNDGDGIIAYQGSSVGSVTTFLHAVGETVAEVGTFPNGFSNYVLIGNDDGEYYNVRSGGTAFSYLDAINDSNNWSTSGSGVIPFNLSFFTFGSETIYNCSELFISEYIEGSSNNKYIEIYNPTNSVISLTCNYSIHVYSNGGNSYTKIDLTGSIDPYDIFVVSHTSAALAVEVNQTSTSLNFNGNDAVALVNTETIVDLVGIIGEEVNFAMDKGLKRKNTVQNPTVNYNVSEWDLLGKDEVSNLGNHFGDCSFTCPFNEATTWNGTSWSNGIPNSSKVAIINGNYDTSTYGSFEACSLVANAGNLLSIANTTFVEIENNIFINGSIVVETKGTLVQKNNEAIFKLNEEGLASVQKTTAPINAWYEYTYWSSPVSNEIIGNALSAAPANRRFWYNAQNYLDATAEIANNNATNAGQDDVDDNGDDWQYAAANDIMIPGVGYAATQSSASFTGLGSQYNYRFTGPFNNGVIKVPVYRNDSELLDTNWNFIGNPYPSAISVDAFFNENVKILNPNGALEGAIYLWSQNTAPSIIANGNSQLNFSQSDYAIINGIGGTATQDSGGDNAIPNRFIPSCQGFFVSFDNNANSTVVSGAIKKGEVFFNNGMRVTNNNTQFFKSAKEVKTNIDNKIWLNLTSNNGVFSQVLVGYVKGATNGFDATFYDATRNVSSGTYAAIYSIIEGNNSKFAIQGKSPESINFEEEIQVGLYTSINTSTNYKLSISKIEGDFLTENIIYLEDSLLGIKHNLSEAGYNFTSELGEFNQRFKILFSNKILLGEEADFRKNELSIINLGGGNVQFSINHSLSIQKIEIIDFLGRVLYQFKGLNSTEIIQIPKINTPIYLARVYLSSGQIIIKKAIKKE